MARIIIDDVESIQDLLNAIAYVHYVFAADPAKFDSVEEYFSKSHGADCNCDACLEAIGVRRIKEIAAAPTPFVPCPRRGSHLRLTECWACWCDVHRGACLETDVLAPEAWDVAIAELVPGPMAGRHRADLPAVTTPTDYVGRHRADIIDGEIVENGEAA